MQVGRYDSYVVKMYMIINITLTLHYYHYLAMLKKVIKKIPGPVPFSRSALRLNRVYSGPRSILQRK